MFIIDVVLVARIVFVKDTLIIFKNIVIVFIARFVSAKVLSIINILFVIFVNTIEKD